MSKLPCGENSSRGRYFSITLVLGPIVSTAGSLNNEAALAVREGVNQTHPGANTDEFVTLKLSIPDLDIVVYGEGECKLSYVLDAYRSNGGFDNVGGIGFLTEGGPFRNNRDMARIREVDDIPRRAWPEGHLEKFQQVGIRF